MTQYPGHITFHPALPWETAKMHSNAHKNTQKCTMFPPCNVNKINHMRAVFGKKHTPPSPPSIFQPLPQQESPLQPAFEAAEQGPKNGHSPNAKRPEAFAPGRLILILSRCQAGMAMRITLARGSGMAMPSSSNPSI